MSNVKFLRGPQGNLDKLTTFTEGAFYVTTDTDRMYFAQSANDLVYLNKHIINVDSISNLPDINTVNDYDFYYAQSENVLCTKLKGVNTWTQINANTDTSVSKLEFNTSQSADEQNPEKKNIVVSYTLTEKNIQGNDLPNKITGNFIIKGEDIGSVISNVALDVDAKLEDNILSVGLNGVGIAPDANGFTITAGDNITFSGSDNNFTISAEDKDTHYDLSSPENSTSIQLKDDIVGNTDIINFEVGENNDSLLISGVDENKIIISHKDYKYEKAALENQNPENANSFDIISGVTLENGHVTGISTSKVTLPDMSYTVGDTAQNDEKVAVSLHNHTGNVVNSISLDDKLYYTVGSGDGAIKLFNQSNLADTFCLKSDFENALKSANAMTFKGTVGSAGTLAELPDPENGDIVNIGDTYLVAGEIGANGGEAGDLFIAAGDEDDNGKLTTVNWILVPAGNEIDTTYSFAFVESQKDGNPTHNLSITNDITGNAQLLSIVGGNTIEVSANGQLKINHSNVSKEVDDQTEEAKNQDQITVVTEVGSNEQGHITSLKTEKFVMPKYKLSNIDNKIHLTDEVSGNSKGIVNITGEEKIKVDVSNTTDTEFKFIVSHETTSVGSSKAGDAVLKAEDTITLLNTISYDSYGHINNIETKDFKLPKDTTYNYSGNVAVNEDGNQVTITTNLANSETGDIKGSHTVTFIADETLKFTKNENSISVAVAGLVWGSF